MSLIDEALKKVSEEAARHEALSQGTAIPYASGRGVERRRFRRGFGIGIGVGLLAAVLVVAAMLLRPGARRASAPDHRAIPAATSTPPPITEEVVVPPPPGMPAPRPAAAAASAAVPATPVHSTPAPKIAPKSAPKAAPKVAPPTKPSAGPIDGHGYPARVDLADGSTIELDGIVYSDTKPVALINGHVLTAGSFIFDFRIVKIDRDHITLEGRGATFTMTMH